MKKLIYLFAVAAIFASCSTNSNVSDGDKSRLDTLSYAIGTNIGQSLQYQLRMIPINYDELCNGLEDGAYGKSKLSTEEIGSIIQDYMMNKRMERSRAIMKQRREADSIRLAQGDSTRVEYPVADPAMFESEKERDEVSYALGANFGSGFVELEDKIELYWMTKGINDVHEETLQVELPTLHKFLQNYSMVVVPQRNLEASNKWLEEIKTKSGVQTTESGLIYKIIEQGDMSVKANDPRDVVKVHYKGTKRTGKVFDASRFADMPEARQEMLKMQFPDNFDKDEPVEFPLNRVIKGWTEGMQLVGKGGKIILWVPSDLAYGPRGNRGIGANEALCFEVELIDVTPHVEPEAEVEEAESPAEE